MDPWGAAGVTGDLVYTEAERVRERGGRREGGKEKETETETETERDRDRDRDLTILFDGDCLLQLSVFIKIFK